MQACGEASVAVAPLRAEDIELVLGRSSWLTIRSLRIYVDDSGSVTVTGYVTRYYEKQVALQQIRRIPGVRDVRDQVEVFY